MQSQAQSQTQSLDRMTTDRSTTVTAIQIQYYTSCTTRTDTAARKRPVQRQQYNIGKTSTAKWQSSIQRGTDEEALQEIVHRAQLTTLSLSHPHTTEDGTKPYLAKPVKGLIKDYKGNGNWTYRSQRFSSEIIFTKDCTADARARDMRRR